MDKITLQKTWYALRGRYRAIMEVYKQFRRNRMPVRTSKSHPLIINQVRVPGGSGVIGITLCPGKTDAGSSGGAWKRDLETDIASLCSWGTSCLVSLMEDHEFDLLRVRQLPLLAIELGLSWFHLPIRDVSIPDFRFYERWSGIGPRLMGVLMEGGRVVIHCRGGLGRSGIVAALLLIETGMDSREAVDAVREARPGAIETIQQEAFVRGYRRTLPKASILNAPQSGRQALQK